jgi:hypothetical protein
MSKKMIIFLVLGGLLLGAILALWGYDRFVNPQEAIDPAAFEGARFPTVRGSNLSGDNFTLPADLEAEYAIAMIAFKQRQQFDINTWLPVASELAGNYPDLVYYEFPTIDRLNPAARAFVDGGMRGGIPDPVARATTITLYLDKPAFKQALEIGSEDSIVVLLINREGEVFWRADGPATEAAVEELKLSLDELFSGG